jgi:hypothetical protein
METLSMRPSSIRPARYAWIIDAVEPDSGLDRGEVGTTGPRNAPDELIAQLETDRDAGQRFRIYDDDRVLYYEGRILLPDDPDAHEEFGPLWDWGAPNAGATEIQCLRDGRYVRL